MGQHHSNFNPNERRGYNKESVTAGSAKIDGRPIIIDHSKALKTQMSEDDHEPKVGVLSLFIIYFIIKIEKIWQMGVPPPLEFSIIRFD